MTRLVDGPSRLAWLLLVSLLLATGCRTGENLGKVNNRLREENLQLRMDNAALEQRLEERDIALTSRAAESGSLTPEIQAVVPRVTRLTIDPLSHVATHNGSQLLRAYLQPRDGRNRFTQLVGTITLQLVATPLDQEAITLARQVFSPAEVCEAYRSGFMGTHYTFELAITVTSDVPETPWLLIVQYEDGVTGATLMAEQRVDRHD